MDKSWMSMDRRLSKYSEGVDRFLEFALLNANGSSTFYCPCTRCVYKKRLPLKGVKDHLFIHGICQRYRTWIWHGEEVPPTSGASAPRNIDDDVDRHRFGAVPLEDVDNTIEMVRAAQEDCTRDPSMFNKLLEDVEKPLYPGCTKFIKISAIAKLYRLKVGNGVTDKCFTELLVLLGDMLPEKNEMPPSMYEAKKTLNTLGLDYEKIHACPSHCILYRKEYAGASECPKCGTSRWKDNQHPSGKKNGVPAKVLWYFPPIPRFRRMFQTTKITRELTWHDRERQVDGILRHPADSASWKVVDHNWPEFGQEPRNLRLGLCADGINPHSSYNSTYSCWPVLMVTYNLPPWLCMKRRFIMLSLLISGPKQPGKNIDVYLAPLIDDLKTLWEVGVETYDAYQKQTFMLKAILLWTINDFPAYGNLSGCKTKGYRACPICSEDTNSIRLANCKKNVYTGHRRFLPAGHIYRNQKKPFNGEQEHRKAPIPLTGEETLRKIEALEIENLFVEKKRKRNDEEEQRRICWNKKLIFFELEYWKKLHIRHNLDVMHIEKNVCESIIGTLLNIPNKTKDGVNARLDWVKLGGREDLAPEKDGQRMYLPPACYTLSRHEKIKVCKTLSEAHVLEGSLLL